MIKLNNVSLSYDKRVVLENLSLTLKDKSFIGIIGKNGSGKSSIIKLILGDKINYQGDLYIQSGLKISYVSQETSHLKGKLTDFIRGNNLDEPLFKSVLRRMDFEGVQFEKDLSRIYELFGKKCEQLHIMGGEPLTNKDITK